MQLSPENDTYSAENLVVVTVASCFSSIAIVGLFYVAISTELLMTFLIAAAWGVIGNFVVAAILLLVRKILLRLPPSWLLVPVLGTSISVFSFLLYVYWETARSHVPGGPFSSPPPPISSVLWGALLTSVLLSSMGVLIAYCGLGAFQNRERSTVFHLD
jgi:hypothetical protein